jgi:hypothetical protein
MRTNASGVFEEHLNVRAGCNGQGRRYKYSADAEIGYARYVALFFGQLPRYSNAFRHGDACGLTIFSRSGLHHSNYRRPVAL